MDDLHDPAHMFTALADCATALQGWYDGGRQGARPPGRLRPINDGPLTPFTRAWATPLPPNASPGAFSGAECTRRCVAGLSVPVHTVAACRRWASAGARRGWSVRARVPVIIAKQRISGCTLTLRMHPEMRWGEPASGLSI